MTSETIKLLHNRVSVRKFADKPVERELIDAVLSAAFRAPTSSNIQAYSVIVVTDKQVQEQLVPITGGQQHVLDAPYFLAFCADLTRIEKARKMNGNSVENNNLELGLVSSIDASLVGMSAYLAAESVGLKGLMIGAVRNDAGQTARVLGLPKRVYCVFGMCLGWPSEAPLQKPRMDYHAMVHENQYGQFKDGVDADSKIERYDASLAAHYVDQGRATTPDSWTNDINKKFHAKQRDGLREQLAGLGFDFR